MAVPSSGELKLSDLAAEFSDSAPHQMSEFYRGGGKVPNAPANAGIPTSGQIGISQFYGAQNRIPLPLSITSSTQNYDIYTQASASPLYSAGATDVTLTISPGVNVGSTSTGTYALSVPGSFTTGDTITIINNGTVIGRGGTGGKGGEGSPTYGPRNGVPGGSGGNAVYVNYPTTITNNGTLAGAGGGGGGGYAFGGANQLAGGGGGGGAGYSGGSGGAGGRGTLGGGSGGTGTLTSGGAGGRGGGGGAFPGGAGGGQGSAGSGGSGGPYGPPGAGGSAGNYIVGSPLVTWPATGTRLGGSS